MWMKYYDALKITINIYLVSTIYKTLLRAVNSVIYMSAGKNPETIVIVLIIQITKTQKVK